ncbi:DUF2931 family protein [Leclercia adecarboxylata]|uniref:DUF2931 family protein n=1 Tax=Leclercia adecarboxylata TaxID=83655 RepID=UPI001117F234|nr:DUF2931 family protein [Leclercia adecarboxylata]
MTKVDFILTTLLFMSVTGCTVEKSPVAVPGETEWGYKKLPYDQWEFLFIYPWALPALATQALMVDGAGYKITYQYVDNTEPSKVSVGRWNDRLGGVETYYNKGKALPLMLRFCWDSVIDKKSYETLVLFKKGTWEQMTTPFTDNYRNETYYRSTMIIGLAPEGKVSVWLGDRGNPVVPQSDAKITTVSGDRMEMCKGVTKSDFSYGYDQDIKEFIEGKTYPYGKW